ncbi:MAG: DUF3558 domain-containing protein [Actinomycetota bacterium]|nr:DUF3558 domain-containing protein [Actinomycetota bacterium]
MEYTMTALRHRLRSATALALIALGMAACGGTASQKTTAGAGSDPAPTARPATIGTSDACSLLTEQEVSTVLGADPGAGTQPAPGPKGNVCTYGDGLGSSPVLHVVLRAKGGRSALENDKVIDRQGVDVAGVADAAYGVFDGGNATVSFSKGDTYVSIGLGSSLIGAIPQRDHAIALAKTAAGRV